MAANIGGIIGGVLGALAVFLFLAFLIKGIKIVREKENMIIERLGVYNRTLSAGVHLIIPWIEYPKAIYERYSIGNALGGTEIREVNNITRISTQNEVLEFPKQNVITRDNATITLDAVLSYKVINPKAMVYSVSNLPNVLSKLLQAQLRNVAGSLDVDQIIEEAASLNVLTGLMDAECKRWGVQISFVKIQKVEAPALEGVLAAKKNADLKNKEVVLNAKSYKQSKVIESEGARDSMIKKAEGEKINAIATAKGQAKAILNNAEGEARSLREIATGMGPNNEEDPFKYVLSLKYIDTLNSIMARGNTNVVFQPKETSFVQTAQDLGFNTVLPQ